MSDAAGMAQLRQVRRNVLRGWIILMSAVVLTQIVALAIAVRVTDGPIWPRAMLGLTAPYGPLALRFHRTMVHSSLCDALDADGRRQVRQALWLGRPPATQCRPAVVEALRPLPWLLALCSLLFAAGLLGLALFAGPHDGVLVLGALACSAYVVVSSAWNLVMGRIALERS